MATSRMSSTTSVGKKGPLVANEPNPPPLVSESAATDNFEGFNPASAKEMRGLTRVDVRNVRGHANYK